MEVYLGKIYTPIVFGDAAPSRAANRYEKIVFVTKVGREYDNTKAHPKNTNSRNPQQQKKQQQQKIETSLNPYRAHTCKYIGVSQTASQNRTKDTNINSEKYS